MTDKEYIRRYTDTAERVQRENPPPIKPGSAAAKRHMDEFIQRFRQVAKSLAEKNIGKMPVGPARAKAMRRSIDKVRDGDGSLHSQPEAPRGGAHLHCAVALD